MEYKTHEAVARDVQEDLVKKYEKARLEKKDDVYEESSEKIWILGPKNERSWFFIPYDRDIL